MRNNSRGGSGQRALTPAIIGQGMTFNANPAQLRLNPPNLAQFNAPPADFLNNSTGGGKRRRRRSKKYKMKGCKSKTLRKSYKYSKKRKSRKHRSKRRR